MASAVEIKDIHNHHKTTFFSFWPIINKVSWIEKCLKQMNDIDSSIHNFLSSFTTTQ